MGSPPGQQANTVSVPSLNITVRGHTVIVRMLSSTVLLSLVTTVISDLTSPSLSSATQLRRDFSVFSHNKKAVCYWGTWANYRPAVGKFTPENIDPTLCTHLIY